MLSVEYSRDIAVGLPFFCKAILPGIIAVKHSGSATAGFTTVQPTGTREAFLVVVSSPSGHVNVPDAATPESQLVVESSTPQCVKPTSMELIYEQPLNISLQHTYGPVLVPEIAGA